MFYFKDTGGRLHCLDSASFAHLLPSGCVQITDAEAQAIQAAANPPPNLALMIQAEIDRLERESMMNRGVRELSLRQMEFFAVQLGQDLETIPAYVKFKALDDQVSALRIQLAELEAQS